MGNLVEYYERLSDEDKNLIMNSWEMEYGQKCSLAVVPFLDYDKAVLALLRVAYTWGNFVGVLDHLEIRLVSFMKEPDEEIEYVVTSDGIKTMYGGGMRKGRTYAEVRRFENGVVVEEHIYLD